MGILLAITEQRFDPSFLQPYLEFDGINDEFASVVDVSESYSDRYIEYLEECETYRGDCGWFASWFAAKPKVYRKWLKDQDVRLLGPLEGIKEGEKVFTYASLDEVGNVRNVYERSNIDIWAKDGGLLHGYRIDLDNTRIVRLLEDGSGESACIRPRQNLNLSVLLEDDVDVQISAWQAWERRYNAYLRDKCGVSFTDWRNSESLSANSHRDDFFLRQSVDIPPECKDQAEFLQAAIMVSCDALLKDGHWYERKSDDWAEVLRWAKFVNETLESTPADHWIATLEY